MSFFSQFASLSSHRARAVLIVSCGILLLSACNERADVVKVEPRPVRTMRITSAGNSASQEERYPGVIIPRIETSLGFQVPGRIVARLVDVGSRVAEGTALARLDARDLALGVESARAALNAAVTESQTTAAELARSRELHAQRVIADAALERAVASAASAAARRDDAKARLTTAENAGRYATLTAPAAGVVTALLAESGQVVAAGQPVVTLARAGEIEVAIDVPEGRIAAVRQGQRASVTLVDGTADLPRAVWQATVRETAPAADPVTGTYRVRLALVRGDAPLPVLGRSAIVGFASTGEVGAYTIPASAVVQTGRTPGVWLLSGQRDRVRFRAIEIGRIGDGDVVVRRGLSTGDEIVVAGANRLDSALVITPWEGRLP